MFKTQVVKAFLILKVINSNIFLSICAIIISISIMTLLGVQKQLDSQLVLREVGCEASGLLKTWKILTPEKNCCRYSKIWTIKCSSAIE